MNCTRMPGPQLPQEHVVGGHGTAVAPAEADLGRDRQAVEEAVVLRVDGSQHDPPSRHRRWLGHDVGVALRRAVGAASTSIARPGSANRSSTSRVIGYDSASPRVEYRALVLVHHGDGPCPDEGIERDPEHHCGLLPLVAAREGRELPAPLPPDLGRLVAAQIVPPPGARGPSSDNQPRRLVPVVRRRWHSPRPSAIAPWLHRERRILPRPGRGPTAATFRRQPAPGRSARARRWSRRRVLVHRRPTVPASQGQQATSAEEERRSERTTATTATSAAERSRSNHRATPAEAAMANDRCRPEQGRGAPRRR